MDLLSDDHALNSDFPSSLCSTPMLIGALCLTCRPFSPPFLLLLSPTPQETKALSSLAILIFLIASSFGLCNAGQPSYGVLDVAAPSISGASNRGMAVAEVEVKSKKRYCFLAISSVGRQSNGRWVSIHNTPYTLCEDEDGSLELVDSNSDISRGSWDATLIQNPTTGHFLAPPSSGRTNAYVLRVKV